MNRRIRSFLIIAASVVTWGCGEESDRTLYMPAISGNQGEIVIFAPASLWEAENGVYADMIRNEMNMIMPGLTAPEPMFTAVETSTEKISDVFKTHRNLLEIKIEPSDVTKVTYRRDVHAKQQFYVRISLQRPSDLLEILKTQWQPILWQFHQAELDRLISRNRAFGDKAFNERIADLTGLEVSMQQDFQVAREDQYLLWLRLDREKPVGGYQHQINQGILIYSRPYTDTLQFSDSSLLAWKNDINKRYVEGPRQSYMSTSYKLYPPEVNALTYRGSAAREIRGLWRMEGSEGVFMGGPFYALSYYNSADGRQYMIEGYVYGPQFNKRAFIREVEAIAKSSYPVASK